MDDAGNGFNLVRKDMDVNDFKRLYTITLIRDRPFNLQDRGAGYGFLFRSEICFRTTREVRNLFPESNIRLYD